MNSLKKTSRTMLSMFAGLALLLAGSAVVPAYAEATTFTENITTQINDLFYVPCASEDVLVTGEIHGLLHITEDPNGGFHVSMLSNPMGVSGVGQQSGDVYRGVGATTFEGYFSPGQHGTITAVDNTILIAPGPGNNLYLQSRLHVTVTPNGEVTAERDIVTVSCR
jgi:hypothetical protein